MSDDQPGGRLGLALITLTDKSIFQSAFAALAQPISDYSFANVFVWTSALRLYWARLRRHVCVFANGTGDLTLLLPPLPEAGATDDELRACLGDAFDIMDGYNRQVCGDPNRSRIEYVSDETLERINAVTGPALRLSATPMSGDYVYPAARMIDLAGGDLKSKRHARSKFMREHPEHGVEDLTEQHVPACLELIEQWQHYADQNHDGQMTEDGPRQATLVLRRRETLACRLALEHRLALGLKGMVVMDGRNLVGFTLGESLSAAQASILFEKTHPDYPGAPQFIFSEFCRRYWSDHPEINVGDDWGVPTLRFTKESYRPTRRLSKYTLTRPVSAPLIMSAPDVILPRLTAAPAVAPDESAPPAAEPTPVIRPARAEDVDSLQLIERQCFHDADAFSPRQIRSLISNPNVLSRVIQLNQKVVGWAVALVRQHRHLRSGRLYNLALTAECRGCGLGAQLVRRLLDELRQRQVHNVYLEVRADNHPAIRLYEKLGFHQARLLNHYYGPQAHGLSMRLTLPVLVPAAGVEIPLA